MLIFFDVNCLSLGEFIVYLNGVIDYSNNFVDCNVKVIFEFDIICFIVLGVIFKIVDGKIELIVEFFEKISIEDYNKVDNYVLKDFVGKIYIGKGFIMKGNFFVVFKYVVDKNGKVDEIKVVFIFVGGILLVGNYIFEVFGVCD